jgi:Ca2+-binding EF-hand superfamily protein
MSGFAVKKFTEMSSDEREAFVVFQKYAVGNALTERGLQSLTDDYKFDYELFKSLVDGNGDCQIAFKEFQPFWTKLKKSNFAAFSGEKMEALRQWLAYYDSIDTDKNGVLSMDELLKFCQTAGMNVTAEQLRGLDKDGSGSIGFEEFLTWYRIDA